MAKKTADKDGAAPEDYLVSAKPTNGFWRAGRHWPKDGVVVSRSGFDDEQWAALEAEPALSVTRLQGAA